MGSPPFGGGSGGGSEAPVGGYGNSHLVSLSNLVHIWDLSGDYYLHNRTIEALPDYYVQGGAVYSQPHWWVWPLRRYLRHSLGWGEEAIQESLTGARDLVHVPSSWSRLSLEAADRFYDRRSVEVAESFQLARQHDLWIAGLRKQQSQLLKLGSPGGIPLQLIQAQQDLHDLDQAVGEESDFPNPEKQEAEEEMKSTPPEESDGKLTMEARHRRIRALFGEFYNSGKLTLFDEMKNESNSLESIHLNISYVDFFFFFFLSLPLHTICVVLLFLFCVLGWLFPEAEQSSSARRL